MLESRVMCNAVNPFDSPAPVVVPVETPAVVGPQPTVHGPGCNCPMCVQRRMESGNIACAIPAMAALVGPEAASASGVLPYPGQTFTLHSRPEATRKIYLDFTGHTTSGTWWNTDATGGAAFTTSAFNFEGTNTDFSTNEQDRIQKIWQRVMEDYSPFDVDVTTEDPGLAGLTYSGDGDTSWGIRVVITPDDAWARPTFGKVGGIAYLPSFKTGTDTTCYIFSSNLGPNNEGYIAEAISHEVGHTLGLSHDGTSVQAYYTGTSGNNTPSWAPIMGVGYGKQLVQWSKGEYADANETQDDLSIITNTANNFGYRPDDAGNTVATATPVGVTSNNLSISGVIEQTTDVDVYRFTTGAGQVSFDFEPWVNSPNLDIRAELRNADGSFSIVSDPQDTLNAFISATITTPGTYYLVIDGVGVGNVTTTGYSDYGSLGQYTITGTVPESFSLSGVPQTTSDYLENQDDFVLSAVSLVSADTNLNQAVVTINNFVAGEDQLLFNNQSGITGNFSNGVLTLSGMASVAAYQTALRSIVYRNLSDNPTTGKRNLSFQVWDTTNTVSDPASLSLNIIAVNDPPTLNVIGDLGLNEDAGLQTVLLTGITPGGGENQTVTVSASSDNPGLIANPVVSADGNLSFTPFGDHSGSAKITVTVTDNGGTANGGVNTFSRTFTITVNPVNDAPSFTKGPDIYAGSNAEGQTIPNWATALLSGPPDESGQTLSFLLSNDANGLFLTQPIISFDGTLTFTPADGVSGVAMVTVLLADDGGTANGGVPISDVQTFKIYVGINRAPEVSVSGSSMLNPVALGSTSSPGTRVGDFATAFMSDPDEGTRLGIAITTADTSNGQWQFSEDKGQTWLNLGQVSESAARLLQDDDFVRFVSNSNHTGTATLTYHAWDQTSGTAGSTANLINNVGGSSAFSAATRTATIRVAGIFSSILEDAKSGGGVLSGLPGTVISDLDPNAKRGIAVVGSDGDLSGTWQFSINAGRSWVSFDTISPSTARLLRSTDLVRFIPAANQSGEVYLTYHAWDQSAGVAGGVVDLSSPDSQGGGTAFSSGVDYLFTVVSPVNDRPVLDTLSNTILTTVSPADTDPTGDTVSAILGSTVTDVDGIAPPGLAVTAFGKTGGVWEYQLAGDTDWTRLPNVSASSAFLLGPTDRLRFRPTTGSSIRTITLSYKAWDRTIGEPGTTTNSNAGTDFSAGVETATLSISSVAAAPASVAPLLNITPAVSLTAILEDSKPTGDLVSTLLGGSTNGVAISGLTGTTTGVWQFSTNSGKTWKAIGDVSTASALLLNNTDKIRYLPNANFNGEATITYRAWNRTRGTAGYFANLSLPDTIGGSSPFSIAEKSASITIIPVNDPPVLNILPKPTFTKIAPNTVDPAGNNVRSLLGTAVTDPDAGAEQGIAVIKAPSTHGVWEFQLAGESTWNPLSASSSSQAMFLRPDDLIRFIPKPSFVGVETLTYRAWDQTTGQAGVFGSLTGSKSVSAATESATITVNSNNDRPVLDTTPNVQLSSVAKNDSQSTGVSSGSLLGSAVTDADAGTVAGIAITAADNKNGTWEYSLDDGSWVSLGIVSSNHALLLKSTDKIRFVPNNGFVGSATIKYKAWDQSDGLAAGQITTAGSTAYSAAIETATVAVNSAPMLTWA